MVEWRRGYKNKTMTSNKKQHMISKALLKQFANGSNNLGVWVLTSEEKHYSDPCKESRIDNFLRAKKNLIESYFKYPEQDIPDICKSLITNNDLKDSLIDSVKNLIALHHVRSLSMHLLWENKLKNFIKDESTNIDKYRSIIAPYIIEGIGVMPNDNEIEALVKNEYERCIDSDNGEIRDQLVLNLYKRITGDFRKNADIEIGINKTCLKFIMPDTAVLLMDTSANKIGIMDGVGIKSADFMGMIFTPHHMISLVTGKNRKNKKRIRYIDESGVARINYNLKLASQKKYYFHPDDSVMKKY